MIPTFSLCHATARLPNGWRAAYESWRANADDWSKVEYILGIDLADAVALGESCSLNEKMRPEDAKYVTYDGISVAINAGRKCAVDAWNATGRKATGRFLITVADDLFPPSHWDTELLKVIPDLDGEYVIEVKSGTSPAD